MPWHPRVSAFLAAHADDYDVIVASRDWHDADGDNGGHFAEAPDFVDTWPVALRRRHGRARTTTRCW